MKLQLLFLLAALWRCAAEENSAASQDDRFLQQFRAMEPQAKLDAYELLAAWCTLQQVADSLQQSPAASASGVEARLLHTRQRLFELLPALRGTGGSPESLLAQAAGALAADLSSPGGVRSRLVRALTLVNIAWFCGCVLLLAAAVALVGQYLAALVLLVPLPVWEAVGYATSAAIIYTATRSREAVAPYVGLTGLLMFTGCAGGTVALHNLGHRLKDKEAAAMGLCALLYGAVAVRLQASLLGTIAVLWAVSALGFSILVLPFVTFVGFRSGMAQPFAASLVLVLAFLPFKVAPAALPMPAALRPFETGVWLWCVLVLNVANLIMAHERWARSGSSGGPPLDILAQLPLRVRLRFLTKWIGRYVGAQLPSLAVIGGTLACGTLLEVEQCRALGATFGLLWFLTKLAEFDWRRVGFAWAALALGTVLWASAYAVHTWPQIFTLSRIRSKG